MMMDGVDQPEVAFWNWTVRTSLKDSLFVKNIFEFREKIYYTLQ